MSAMTWVALFLATLTAISHSHNTPGATEKVSELTAKVDAANSALLAELASQASKAQQEQQQVPAQQQKQPTTDEQKLTSEEKAAKTALKAHCPAAMESISTNASGPEWTVVCACGKASFRNASINACSYITTCPSRRCNRMHCF